MKKITKKDLNERLLMVETLLGLHRERPEQISIDKANDAIFRMQWTLSRGKELAETEPKLKQLDQSVFKEWAGCWKFFAIDKNGQAWRYREEPKIDDGDTRWSSSNTVPVKIGEGYDASDWQNSLIERDTAKELLEVDLSSELTGSDYFHSNITSALLESGSKLVVCFVSNVSESDALSEKHIEVIIGLDVEFNDSDNYGWQYAIPINNQGEPLTQSDVGL